MTEHPSAAQLNAAEIPNRNQTQMHAHIKAVSILISLFAVGLAIYDYSLLSVLWLLTNAALGWVLSKTDFEKDQSVFALWRIITIVGAVVSASLPLYICGQGELAGVVIGMLYLAANTVMVSSFDHDDNSAVIVLGIFAASLVAAPLAMGIGDPHGDWLPYLAGAFGAVMFLVQVAYARMVTIRSRLEATRQYEEVRRQEALTRMMFDTSSLVISLLDQEFRCVRVNKAFRDYYADGSPIGRSYLDYLAQFGVDMTDQFKRCLAGETVRSENIEMRTDFGDVYYAGFESAPWREPNGAIVGIMCFSWDMTDRVVAQRNLMRSFECLDVALHASNSVVLERDLITGERRWIGSSLAVYGRHVTDEMLDRFDPDLFPEESVAVLKHGIQEAKQNGYAEFTHSFKVSESEIGWLSIHAKYIYDEFGISQRLIYKITNVTQKKREEQDLLDALSRATKSLAAKRSLLADLAHESGLDGSFEVEDLAHMYVGSKAQDEKDGVSEIAARFQNLLEEVDIRDEALGRAVASLRKAREASESANLAKSQFLANMSHELRTPLNAILGYSEILLEDAKDEGRDSDIRDLERVLAAARSLLVLINEILDLSKIEAGRMEIAIGDYSVRTLVEDAVSTVRLMAEKNGNIIKVEMDPSLETGRSDAFKLNQCLLNLLSNAVKFTKDGCIDVHATLVRERALDWLRITVSDDGIGMNDEQIGRLFQPFSQADASVTRKYGGTGLGLVITRRMMQLMGGDVSVRSREGEGSIFTMMAPLNLQFDEQAQDHSVSLGDSNVGPLVLVIDDEDDVAELVRRSIGRLGFRVASARTARGGLRAAEKLKPALILLDINLPDRSGWNVLEDLSAMESTKDMPVIVHSIHDDQMRALTLGACAHFVKPTDRDVLASAIVRFARSADAPLLAEAIPANAADRQAS